MMPRQGQLDTPGITTRTTTCLSRYSVCVAPDSDEWASIVEDTGELVEAFFKQV
jgi:hypothetical protein